MIVDPQAAIRVLHIDDDQRFGDLAAQFLEEEDDRIEVITESNAEEGLARFRETDIDCIVSDYALPDGDGLDLLQTIREDNPDLPFIFFTGKGSEEVAGEAISAGVTDYLQKQSGPEQYAILANRIVNAVARHRGTRQIDLSHRALETATEGLSLVNPDGTFSYVNPAFAELFGYDPDALIGADWSVLYHNAEAKRLESQILPAVRETGYWAGETVRLTNDGDRLVTDHRLAYTDPDIDVIVCSAKDFTEERIDPVDQSTPFDLLTDTMDGDAFYTLDHEGYLTRWNEGATQVFGYDSAEVLGKHISVFFTDEDRQRDVPERLLDTANAEGSVTETYRQCHEDGTRFEADMTVSASYDTTGTLVGFGTVVHVSSDPTSDVGEVTGSKMTPESAGESRTVR